MKDEIALRVLICDDEEPAHIILKEYCGALTWVNEIDHAYDGLEAYEKLHKQKYDILLLDIEMPKLKGIELAEQLSEPPIIIITTAYPDFALDGYRIEALDYLLKPIRVPRFIEAMERAKNRVSERLNTSPADITEQHIWVRADKIDHRVALQDIQWIEADGDYLRIHVVHFTKALMVYKRMSEILKELPETDFIQVHRSFIVHSMHVRAVEGNQVVIGEKRIPVSKSNREYLRTLFKAR